MYRSVVVTVAMGNCNTLANEQTSRHHQTCIKLTLDQNSIILSTRWAVKDRKRAGMIALNTMIGSSTLLDYAPNWSIYVKFWKKSFRVHSWVPTCFYATTDLNRYWRAAEENVHHGSSQECHQKSSIWTDHQKIILHCHQCWNQPSQVTCNTDWTYRYMFNHVKSSTHVII